MSTSDKHIVELPGGGATLPLQTAEEVDRWETLRERYTSEYELRKINDQTNLGTLLVQHINLMRAQLGLSGRVAETDADELPTGRYQQRVLKPAEAKAYQEQIREASKEIREIERVMGIDKKSRDAAGEENNKQWLMRMKARSVRYGLHVSHRVTKYEELAMELSWRVRLNENGDPEDKHYEDCSDEGIVRFIRAKLAEVEENDKKFAHEEGALVLGSSL